MAPEGPKLDEPGSSIAPEQIARPPFQFSIRAVLIATAIVAVLCWIFFTLPAWGGLMIMSFAVLLSMPATLAALIYGRGRTRAFAVGAMPPMCIVFLRLILGRGMWYNLPFLGSLDDDLGLKIFCSVVTVVVVSSGFVGQAVRAWCLRSVN